MAVSSWDYGSDEDVADDCVVTAELVADPRE
jgi:hypothetical protein